MEGISAGIPPRSLSRQTLLIIGGLAGVVGLALLVALLLTGELFKFMEVGFIFVPLATLAALAYVGTKSMVGVIFSYIALAMVGLGVVFYALTSVLTGYIADWGKFSALLHDPTAYQGQALLDVFRPGAGPALLWSVVLLTVASIIAGLMLLRPVRVAIARIMPIDPDNFVHKIALSILTLILLTSFVPLIVTGGRPPLLDAVNNQSLKDTGIALTVRPVDVVYQFVWMIPAVLLAAGWPIVRKFPDMLRRLGVVRPTVVQVVGAVVGGLALAVVAALVIDPGINWLWHALGWPTTDTAAFDQLLKGVVKPGGGVLGGTLGAVLLGVTAGVGEELAVRGLLQPRIGLIASNLVFTSFHAFQYGPDALLSVFIIGLILGIVRARTNTTTSAILHGIYDFVLVMAVVLGIGQ